jgi:hypothetical protein
MNVAITTQGQPVPGAKRYVYSNARGALCQIYSDPDLTTPIPNPMVAGQQGQFAPCYLVDGAYRIVITDHNNKTLLDQSDVVITSEDGLSYGSVAGLIEDTALSYNAEPGRRQVVTGQPIPIEDRNGLCVIAAQSATDYHLQTAGGVKFYTSTPEGVLEVDRTLRFENDPQTGLEGIVIKQAMGADLDQVTEIAMSTTNQTCQARLDLHVDGNQGQNLPTIGILASAIKRGSNTARLSANACDIGVKLTGNIEYAAIDTHAEDCRVGVQVTADSAVTPDELVLRVLAHDCDTFFEATGAHKISGTVDFGCERAASWGANFDRGWWDIRGLLRSVGRGTGGGIRVDGADLRGNIKIAGGSASNCAWGAELVSGTTESLQMNIEGDYVDGVLVHGGMEGSAKVILGSIPQGTTGLKLGVAGATPLNGYHIEGGSRISAGNGQTAIALTNCQNCLIEPSHVFGQITIGTDSAHNTLIIPRRNAVTGVTIANAATSLTNKVIFRGTYTLSELAALTGGVHFVGMEVEACSAWDGARGRFDGSSWVSETGYLASGKATISATDTQVLAPHGLPSHPGDSALSIYPANHAAAQAPWWADVATTYVGVNVDASATADLESNWVLRKAG